uniref:ADP-ribosyl cyclase/cyclic ADP-ribose hydrolase n=1 Tax=Seriola lalandi dorsalis TaxID=1841481 RepID=A0A3B4YE96_SERLL
METKMIVICVLAALAVLAVIIGVLLGLYLPRTKQCTFHIINTCYLFFRDYCQNVLNVFEGAYVGRHKCDVPMENYNSLMSTVKFDYPCSQTMLWSDTKDLVSQYTKNNPGCFNLEKTLLGFVLDGQSWCGKEGSKGKIFQMHSLQYKNIRLSTTVTNLQMTNSILFCLLKLARRSLNTQTESTY